VVCCRLQYGYQSINMCATLSAACLSACPAVAGYVWEFSMLDTPHELEMQEGMATGSSQASFALIFT
jgi:hypothetical protein